jgi:hypothetical protein
MAANATTPAPQNSTEMICFLCRFDMGVSVGPLEAGAFGLLLVATTLCCCCLCYSVLLYCACLKTPPYMPVASSPSDAAGSS